MVSLFTILVDSLLLGTFLLDPIKIFRNPTTFFLIGSAIGRSRYWIGTRTYLCHLFHASVLSTSFVIKICSLDAIWALFCRVLRLYITINCLCLHINAIYRSCIASEVRLHDYKEESFHSGWCNRWLSYTRLFFTSDGCSTEDQRGHRLISSQLHRCSHRHHGVHFLHYTTKEKMAVGRSLQNESSSTSREEGRHMKVQRSVVRVNFFLLIVLIVSFVPSIILLTMRFIMEGLFGACAIKVQIVNLMADNLICLKFLLDPVVYVWRIPKYHESLRRFCR